MLESREERARKRASREVVIDEMIHALMVMETVEPQEGRSEVFETMRKHFLDRIAEMKARLAGEPEKP